jgi:hypothetical protein
MGFHELEYGVGSTYVIVEVKIFVDTLRGVEHVGGSGEVIDSVYVGKLKGLGFYIVGVYLEVDIVSGFGKGFGLWASIDTDDLVVVLK